MQFAIALLAGILFGAGLTVAQMVDPQKVLNFLDVAAIATGTWDPTLLFVFAGALPTMFAAYCLQRKMPKPAYDAAFRLPARSDIDAPLVIGSAVFGIGWGLCGVCPGPAVAALSIAGSGLANVAIFVAAMMAGIALTLVRPSAGAVAKP